MAISNAERQRRYRERRKEQQPRIHYRQPQDRRSRPQRWAEAVKALRQLQGEYEDWLSRLPVPLQNSALAAKLRAVGQLDMDQLDIDIPRGFGRDIRAFKQAGNGKLQNVETFSHGEGIRLYNADCIEAAKRYLQDSSVDLLIADPPFSIDEKRLARLYSRYPDKVIPGYIFAPTDYESFSLAWMKQAYRILKSDGSAYVITGWSHGHVVQAALLKVGFVLINEIICQFDFPLVTKHKFSNSHYRILYCKKSQHAKPRFNRHCRFDLSDKDENGKSLHYRDMGSVWRFPRESRRGTKKHLTKLPDELVRKMLAYSSNESDRVADFFLGSGTTAIQAYHMKRLVVGFEQNPNAFQHIITQIGSIEGSWSAG
jgi:site-specific DNA-methyltransferase (adenine-specific)